MSDRDVAQDLMRRATQRHPAIESNVVGYGELVDALAAMPLEKIRGELSASDQDAIVEILATKLDTSEVVRTQVDAVSVLVSVGAAISTDTRLSLGVREAVLRDCLYCGYSAAGGGSPTGEPSPEAGL